jgi:hypothetical protein
MPGAHALVEMKGHLGPGISQPSTWAQVSKVDGGMVPQRGSGKRTTSDDRKTMERSWGEIEAFPGINPQNFFCPL